MPTIIMTHNKALAAQLYAEFRSFFPDAHVEYFVSYYDYYQPEAYIPRQDLFIEKDYIVEKLPSPKNGYKFRIYNTYELFITFLLLHKNPLFRLPEDTACNSICYATRVNGLEKLGIKDPQTWPRILIGRDSVIRTGEEKIQEFFKHLRGSKLKKAMECHDRIKTLYKKPKPELKSASCEAYDQPGLQDSYRSPGLSEHMDGGRGQEGVSDTESSHSEGEGVVHYTASRMPIDHGEGVGEI